MMMGVENEYAFSASLPGGGAARVALDRLAQQLLEIVRHRHSHLPDVQTSGMFLANGARFYIDAGEHPEYSTPECSSPREVACAAAAGAAILEEARTELERRSGHSVVLGRRNVDYRTGATWGCHESYSHIRSPDEIWDDLLPHLVTRIVYTGAGGFTPGTPTADFQISPRVPHLMHVMSDNSTGSRGILHTKDEQLCREDRHRLHLICGEALYSQRANVLKVGTTALVLRMIDAGRDIGADLAFQQPLAAMQAFSRDPSLDCRRPLETSGHASAIEVQRALLERVEAELDQPFLPGWAESVCQDWRLTLDLLTEDPRLTASYLDWSAKKALFDQHRAERSPHLTASALRAELFELDARYGQLGPGGLAALLEREGLLDPPVLSADEIGRACTHAPAGRAARRGERIRALHPATERYRCHWDTILDTERERILQLSLDGAGVEQWLEPDAIPRIDPARVLHEQQRLRRLRARARAFRARVSEDEPELPF
jgi:proteasome accessory factor A